MRAVTENLLPSSVITKMSDLHSAITNFLNKNISKVDKEVKKAVKIIGELIKDKNQQLIDDLGQNVAQINSVEFTTDNDNLHFRKGQLAILATVFNLEAQIQNAEQEAKEPVQEQYALET